MKTAVTTVDASMLVAAVLIFESFFTKVRLPKRKVVRTASFKAVVKPFQKLAQWGARALLDLRRGRSLSYGVSF